MRHRTPATSLAPVLAALALATAPGAQSPAQAQAQSQSQAVEAVPVRITVTGLAKPGGVLLVGAYVTAASWLGPDPVFRQDVPVPAGLRDGTLQVEVRLPPGRYALSLFQDMNGNRRLDTNFLGIPTEASGSSNNPPARFSAPKFADALITLGTQPLDLSIRLD